MSNENSTTPKRLAFFERYLTVWVFLCMVAGVLLGKLAPAFTASLSQLEFGQDSHVNVPIAVLIWLMIYPMMLKVDFTALGGIARKPKGLAVTLFVNWLVKPFSMAFLAWLFMQHVFAAWIEPETAKNYTAGLIILAAAPCTAMVFVWSYLTDGDPVYTLVQVAVNDLIMLVAFAPIVMFLCGVANVVVPSKVLITSVVVFIVIPLAAGWLTRTALLKSHGKDWFEQKFLPKFHPVTITALLLTLVLIFAFQAENLTTRWLAVLLAGRADCHPGLFQFDTRLPADAAVARAAQRRLARRAHRREQFLRAGGGGGHHSVRPRFRRGAGHGCWRACRSAGDALRVPHLQPVARVVSARNKLMKHPTTNIQRPTSNADIAPTLDVGCSLLGVRCFPKL